MHMKIRNFMFRLGPFPTVFQHIYVGILKSEKIPNPEHFQSLKISDKECFTHSRWVNRKKCVHKMHQIKSHQMVL